MKGCLREKKMIVIGVLVIFVLIVLPGLLATRIIRAKISALDTILYSVGFGLLFSLLAGLMANFTGGMNLGSVLVAYIVCLSVLAVISWRFGKELPLKWQGWRPLAIPLSIYLVSIALQWQTTLMSSNLVGSDIHLEYFVANKILEQGVWNPLDSGTTLNASLGIAVLLPVYKILSGIPLIWLFKAVAPMIFAVLPLVLYRIFKGQFGVLAAILAVAFFVTMPTFTMDLVQLVRQQQAELFFVLVLLVLMDDNLSLLRKIIIGVVFSGGVLVSHVGTAIGFVGYLMSVTVLVFILTTLWRNRVDDAKKPILSRIALPALVLFSLVGYVGYYGMVSSGRFLSAGTIPVLIAQSTVSQVVAGANMKPPDEPVMPTRMLETPPIPDNPVENRIPDRVIATPLTPDSPVENRLPFFQRFSFLDPLRKEPLAQTAIGLDFGKASSLGRVWRILQYLVEICLIAGLFKILLRPPKGIKLEYVAFVLSSFVVLAGVYLLSTYGWGLGTPRIWGITLLFIAPLFVVGASAIGKWLLGWCVKNNNKMVVGSVLVILLPYYIFNSGLVFEMAKMESKGFIDVPYSIVLSGRRIDIATTFTQQDIEAMDRLKMLRGNSTILYADAHGGSLVVQRIGLDVEKGEYKFLWLMDESDGGYIFLRKWNVDNNAITLYRDYATRERHEISDYPILKDKIDRGSVVYDNGARIIKIP